MQPEITSKLPNVGTTIFTLMSGLATEHNAINLGQGFPDYEMNPALIALVDKAMRNGHNQYVHTNGLPSLRERIAEKANGLYQSSINPNTEITITPGGTYAIYTALTAILKPNDEVILFEPAYDSYIPNIEINGAIAVPIALKHPDYSIDWMEVKAKINANTKAIIVNTPHNPSGAVWSEADFLALQEIVENTNIFIISDEVYEHLIFDNKIHHSLLKYPALQQRAFICFSLGKVYNCTGWKIGYCIAPEKYTIEFRKVHQYNCFTSFGPIQHALAEFLTDQSHYLQLGKQLEQKRDFLHERLNHTGLTPIPSFGSYFQLYSYKGLSEKNEFDFAKQLVVEAGVATIPVSAFYKKPVDNQVLRFCFAKKESTLEEASQRLTSFFIKLKN